VRKPCQEFQRRSVAFAYSFSELNEHVDQGNGHNQSQARQNRRRPIGSKLNDQRLRGRSWLLNWITRRRCSRSRTWAGRNRWSENRGRCRSGSRGLFGAGRIFRSRRCPSRLRSSCALPAIILRFIRSGKSVFRAVFGQRLLLFRRQTLLILSLIARLIALSKSDLRRRRLLGKAKRRCGDQNVNGQRWEDQSDFHNDTDGNERQRGGQRFRSPSNYYSKRISE